MILEYSAMNKIANWPEEYSIINPESHGLGLGLPGRRINKYKIETNFESSISILPLMK